MHYIQGYYSNFAGIYRNYYYPSSIYSYYSVYCTYITGLGTAWVTVTYSIKTNGQQSYSICMLAQLLHGITLIQNSHYFNGENQCEQNIIIIIYSALACFTSPSVFCCAIEMPHPAELCIYAGMRNCSFIMHTKITHIAHVCKCSKGGTLYSEVRFVQSSILLTMSTDPPRYDKKRYAYRLASYSCLWHCVVSFTHIQLQVSKVGVAS